ncbi:CASP-like protein [Actinidia chinensis var. chinensis]|uniref:CASP-like protein n=1 Tax=Actinidia chinensis var. chinensis TaxID=1590841 RepID=A0A2R6PDG4_ACTCC|nr:CASP-like protein [Actinidia chinensis var. chinensis]
MDGVESKIMQNPPLKTDKYSLAVQICLRFLATMASLAAAWIMFTSKQSIVLYGINIDARYYYSSAFKFFAIANLIASIFSVVSLLAAAGILSRNCSDPNKFFCMFLHDLVVMSLILSACAAATAIGFVGRYGNSHIGWMAICDHFARFCDTMTISVALSYVSFVLYLLLTLISATKSRKIQA